MNIVYYLGDHFFGILMCLLLVGIEDIVKSVLRRHVLLESVSYS